MNQIGYKGVCMKRKLLCIISIFILITACGIIIGCKGENSEPPRVRGEAIDSDTVMNKALGFVATDITTADEYVADAEIRKQNDGISIKAYSDGTTTLTAYDWWGNTATVEVVVENSNITALNVSAFGGNVSNIMFFGAKANGVNDDSAAIKKAIDSLPNGGTIKISASSTTIRKLMLYCDSGITLGYAIDDGGNITVKVNCDAGKTFAGWYTPTSTKYTSATAKLSANVTLTAKVK